MSSTHATIWFRSWKQKYPKCKREGVVGVDGEGDELTTNKREKKLGDVENHFYWDSRLAGGRRNFEDDQASVLASKDSFWYSVGAGVLLGCKELGRRFSIEDICNEDCPRKSTAACRVGQDTILRRELIL